MRLLLCAAASFKVLRLNQNGNNLEAEGKRSALIIALYQSNIHESNQLKCAQNQKISKGIQKKEIGEKGKPSI